VSVVIAAIAPAGHMEVSADRRVMVDGAAHIVGATKIARLDDDVVAGLVGDVDATCILWDELDVRIMRSTDALARWARRISYDRGLDESTWELLVAHRCGDIITVDHAGAAVRHSGYAVIGESAAALPAVCAAVAACHESPSRIAVDAVCAHVATCGGPIDTIRLGPPE